MTTMTYKQFLKVTVTREELAELFRVPLEQITSLEEEGYLPHADNDGNFNLVKACRGVFDFIKEAPVDEVLAWGKTGGQ
jgi:hypothetical protein